MKCQICNEKLGEYQCSVCGKVVCKDHSRTVDGKIYCIDHIPAQVIEKEETPKPTPSNAEKAIRNLIITLLALLLGLGAIYYIFQASIIELFGTEGFLGLAGSIQSTINLLFIGIGGLTLLLIIIYLFIRFRKK